MAPLLLRGGRVVDPASGFDQVADVLVKGGRVEAVGKKVSAPAGVTIVECAEKVVLPGLVDMHVHLREPGREDEETVASGTRAAAHGGFTALAAMPNTLPVCDEGAAVRFLVERAATEGVVRVYPVGAATVGSKGEALAEIGDMVAEGAVAVSDDGRGVQDTGMMRRVMDYSKYFSIPVLSHCEDESLVGHGVVNEGVVSTRLGLAGWPAAAEEIQVARDIQLCRLTSCALHVQHISSKGSVELVRQAKEEGLRVTAEVTPHHLFLDEDAIDVRYPTNLKMNPPLRSAEDREALVAGLLDGTIDCIATDHAPHAAHEKALEFELAPFGTTGIETALSLVVTKLVDTGKMTWATLADRMSAAPRRILGLEPVGVVAGSVADLTIVDPEAQFEVTRSFFLSRSANSAFLGATLLGKASEVVVGGKLVVRAGKVVA